MTTTVQRLRVPELEPVADWGERPAGQEECWLDDREAARLLSGASGRAPPDRGRVLAVAIEARDGLALILGIIAGLAFVISVAALIAATILRP